MTRSLPARPLLFVGVALVLTQACLAGTPAAADPAVPVGTISTYAGTGASGATGDGGSAKAAPVDPISLDVTTDGGIVFADTADSVVRKIRPDGSIVRVAGLVGEDGYNGEGQAVFFRLNGPISVAATPDGGFLIADRVNQRIRKVTADGAMSTVAGTGTGGFSGDGGPATAAQINDPYAVAVTADGGFLIADRANYRVRRVSPSGVISTVAGTGVSGYNGDGAVATVNLEPQGVDEASDGSVLVTEAATNRVRRITGGQVTTVAGGGGSLADGVPATTAQLLYPYSVDAIPGGGFYVADSDHNKIRRVDAAGKITTLAGNGSGAFGGDGGQASAASLKGVRDVAFLRDGSLVIGDYGNKRIRRVEGTDAPTLSVPPRGRSTVVRVRGVADAAATVSLFTTPGCSGAPVATGTGAALTTGIPVKVAANAPTTFRATATALGFSSGCGPASAAYVADTLAPRGTIAKLRVKSRKRTATVWLGSNEPGSTFTCRLDKKAPVACVSGRRFTKVKPRKHTLRVVAIDRAGNTDLTPAVRTFRIKR